jgi:hypothetical protein
MTSKVKQFVGVNVRDSKDTANSFRRNFKVNYPTLIDANTGSVVLAFTGVVTPSAVPTTLVIDRQGRVAARILGLAEKATLKALIKSVIAEAKQIEFRSNNYRTTLGISSNCISCRADFFLQSMCIATTTWLLRLRFRINQH